MPTTYGTIQDEIQLILKALDLQDSNTLVGYLLTSTNLEVLELARRVDFANLLKTEKITLTAANYVWSFPVDFLRLSKTTEAQVAQITNPTQDTGSGLSDIASGGIYTGTDSTRYYRITIDATGTPDTFLWEYSTDDSTWTTGAAGVSMTGSAQTLDNGVTVLWSATTGHTLNDVWTFDARDYTYIPITRVTRDEINYVDPDHDEVTTNTQGPLYVCFESDKILVQPMWAGALEIVDYYRKPVAMTTTASTLDLISDGTSGDLAVVEYLVHKVTAKAYRVWLHQDENAVRHDRLAKAAMDNIVAQMGVFSGSPYVTAAY
jgi:hypothetical protein